MAAKFFFHCNFFPHEFGLGINHKLIDSLSQSQHDFNVYKYGGLKLQKKFHNIMCPQNIVYIANIHMSV